MSGRRFAIIAGLGLALVGVGMVPSAIAHPAKTPVRHVLLISVDGLHESDLAGYVATHPHSALADLVSGGTDYTHAQTTFRRTRSRAWLPN